MINIKKIEKIKLEKGEVLVIKTNGILTFQGSKSWEEVSKELKKVFPNNKIMIIPNDTTFIILKKGDNNE